MASTPDPSPEAVTLRGYQQQALDIARRENVVVAGVTGVGKTLVALFLLREQDYSGGK